MIEKHDQVLISASIITLIYNGALFYYCKRKNYTDYGYRTMPEPFNFVFVLFNLQLGMSLFYALTKVIFIMVFK